MIQVNHHLSSKTAIVGDYVTYAVTATSDAASRPHFFVPTSNKLGDFFILKQKTTSKKVGTQILTQKTYTLSAYQTGSVHIPIQTVFYQENGVTQSILLDKMSLDVQSVVTENIASANLRPLAQPLSLAMNLGPYIEGLLGSLLFALLLAYAYRYWKQRHLAAHPPHHLPSDPLSAADRALAELVALKARQFLEKGEVKAHYMALTDIIKHYFSERYEHPVTELTTEECLAALEHVMDDQTLRRLRHVLRLSDLAKFAKYVPTSEENEENWNKTHDCIYRTRILPEIASEDRQP